MTWSIYRELRVQIRRCSKYKTNNNNLRVLSCHVLDALTWQSFRRCSNDIDMFQIWLIFHTVTFKAFSLRSSSIWSLTPLVSCSFINCNVRHDFDLSISFLLCESIDLSDVSSLRVSKGCLCSWWLLVYDDLRCFWNMKVFT